VVSGDVEDSVGRAELRERLHLAGTKKGVFISYNGGVDWTGPCVTNGFNTMRQDITGLIARKTGSSTTLYAAVGTRGLSTTVQYDLDLNGANGIYTTTVPASGCPATWHLVSRADNGWLAGSGSGTPPDSLSRTDRSCAGDIFRAYPTQYLGLRSRSHLLLPRRNANKLYCNIYNEHNQPAQPP